MKDTIIEKQKEIIIKLKSELNSVYDLLNSAKCPDCDGSGVIAKEIIKTGTRWVDDGQGNPLPEPYPIQDYEQSQCYWCYTRDLFLKPDTEVKQLESELALLSEANNNNFIPFAIDGFRIDIYEDKSILRKRGVANLFCHPDDLPTIKANLKSK